MKDPLVSRIAVAVLGLDIVFSSRTYLSNVRQVAFSDSQNLHNGFSVQNDRALSFDSKDLENRMGTGSSTRKYWGAGTRLQAVSEGGIFLGCLGTVTTRAETLTASRVIECCYAEAGYNLPGCQWMMVGYCR